MTAAARSAPIAEPPLPQPARPPHPADGETARRVARLRAGGLGAPERVAHLERRRQHGVEHALGVDGRASLSRQLGPATRSPGGARAPRSPAVPSPMLAAAPIAAPGATPTPSASRAPSPTIASVTV